MCFCFWPGLSDNICNRCCFCLLASLHTGIYVMVRIIAGYFDARHWEIHSLDLYFSKFSAISGIRMEFKELKNDMPNQPKTSRWIQCKYAIFSQLGSMYIFIYKVWSIKHPYFFSNNSENTQKFRYDKFYYVVLIIKIWLCFL